MSIKDVLAGQRRWWVEARDAVAFMDSLPPDSVNVCFGSPPYADARAYGIDAVYECQEWVDWMLKVTAAAVRVSKGLVLWVAAGVQRESVYWPYCEGLMWEWWKAGNHLWCPAVWWKVDEHDGGTGIPGSGGNVSGRRWLRKDWEYVMCFKKEGLIPYDHPTEMGHAPVYSHVGGEMSNRTADGRRINEAADFDGCKDRRGAWNTAGENGLGGRHQNGAKKSRKKNADDPWDKHGRGNNLGGRKANGVTKRGTTTDEPTMDAPGGTNGDGTRKDNVGRPLPKIANPGNVLANLPEDDFMRQIVVKSRVGGGHMGSTLCHLNEAPFPESLAEFFVKSYSPVDGIVLDCFSGSGTTAAVSIENGRRFLGCDLRDSQVELTRRRISGITPDLFPV